MDTLHPFQVQSIFRSESIELSLFRNKSETTLEDTVLDLEFLVDIEVQRANSSIYDYILNSPLPITVTNIPKVP